MLHAQHRLDPDVLEPGITGERLAHHALFAGKLALIGQMLDLAAAANAKNRTGCIHPVGRAFFDLLDDGGNELVRNAGNLRLDDFPRDGAFDKHRFAAVIADPFAVDPKPLDRDDDPVARLQPVGLLAASGGWLCNRPQTRLRIPGFPRGTRCIVTWFIIVH